MSEQRLTAYRHKVGKTRDGVRTHLRIMMLGELQELGHHKVHRARPIDLHVHLSWVVLTGSLQHVERSLERG